MPNRICALLASALLLLTTTACGTRGEDLPRASDIAPSRDLSSWCQGDRPLQYAQADEEGQDDPGNQLDTEETVAAIQAHNVRLEAACNEDKD